MSAFRFFQVLCDMLLSNTAGEEQHICAISIILVPVIAAIDLFISVIPQSPTQIQLY